MKSKIIKLAAGLLALLSITLTAAAHDGFPPPVFTAARLAPRIAHNFAQSWRPREIRAVSILPFATCYPVAYPAAYGVPAAAPLYYSVAAPDYARAGYVGQAPAEQTITVTITVPVSVARELIASGAIKLPSP